MPIPKLTPILVSLCFLFASGVIWIRTATVKTTYQFVKLEKKLTALQEKVQSERVHWLQMTSPKKLEKLAHDLNLHPPKIHQRLKLRTRRNTAGG